MRIMSIMNNMNFIKILSNMVIKERYKHLGNYKHFKHDKHNEFNEHYGRYK